MTLSTTTNRISYSGNGITLVFNFPYYFFLDSDLKVLSVDDITRVQTLQILNTDYTVTGEGVPAGGAVTFVAAPATGKTIVIYRDPIITQDLDLVDNDALPAEPVEARLDKAAMIDQRLSDRVDRAVVLPDGFTSTFDLHLPALLADNPDTVVAVNATGDGWDIGPTITDIANAAVNAAAAAASAAAAAASQAAAAASAAAALASQTAAAGSAAAALASQTAAAASAAAALASQTAAAASAAAALVSETNAATSETNAATSETNAAISESNAATSETNAAASAALATGASAGFRPDIFIQRGGVTYTDSVDGVRRMNGARTLARIEVDMENSGESGSTEVTVFYGPTLASSTTVSVTANGSLNFNASTPAIALADGDYVKPAIITDLALGHPENIAIKVIYSA